MMNLSIGVYLYVFCLSCWSSSRPLASRAHNREEARVYDDYVRALLFEVAVSKGTNNKDSL